MQRRRIRKSKWWLARLKDNIKNGDVNAAVLPAYMHDHKHWIMKRIDFEIEEIPYGRIIPISSKILIEPRY